MLTDTSAAVTITGPSAGVTVSGGGNSPVFQVDAVSRRPLGTDDLGRLDQRLRRRTVQPGHDHADQLVTVTGNSAAHNGGGVYNKMGTVTLTDSTFADNWARMAADCTTSRARPLSTTATSPATRPTASAARCSTPAEP